MSEKQEIRYAVVAACVVMFAEGFCATMNFPFASFMIEHLRGTDEHLGIMTGFFFTAYSIGTLLTARMWAAQANCFGRRACLLVSIFCSTFLTLATAFCSSYRLAVVLRFSQGALNCTLPMTRTILRERIEKLKGDEVRAFSLLQAAFAASCVVGPALGGILYGPASDHGVILFWTPLKTAVPWTPPYIVATCLFVLAFTFSCAFMVETVDLEVPSSLRCQQSKEVVLFSDVSIFYFLVMVAGHSYVFTGWEVGYPLLARNTYVEAWTSARIGITFLIGSLGLLLHTLFTYPIVVKNMGLSTVWSWSWILCIVVLVAFPRILLFLLGLGYDGNSLIIIFVNYVAQLCISVLQGCNFTTLQLMLNRLISAREKSEHVLPLANGWMQSLQSLARSISPIMTGSFVACPSIYDGVLSFDVLAGIAAIGCLLFGNLLRKTLDKLPLIAQRRKNSLVSEPTSTACPMPAFPVENEPSPGDATDGYQELKETESVASARVSSTLIGYMFTIALALTGAVITLLTGFASKSIALPHYTENLTRCLAGSLTMSVLCVYNGVRVVQDSKTMRSSFWLAIADWFFLWGYVKALAYLDTTQFAATSVSMTPILSVLLGFFVLSERASFCKMIAMLRNVVVVMLVVDPFGFFSLGKQPGSSEAQGVSSTGVAYHRGLVSGFIWGLVACLGSVFMRIVQRSLTHVPSTVTSFWCFAINTVLWFPPGSIPPEVRIPFLWPKTPQDAIGFAEVPVSVWACTVASGALGASMIAGQAITLKYIDVGTYSNLMAPLNLVFSFVIDVVQSVPQPPQAVFGVLLAVIGIAIEATLTKSAATVAPRQDTSGMPKA